MERNCSTNPQAPPKLQLSRCALLLPLAFKLPQDHTVVAGHTAADEMCNLYLMLYSQLPYFGWCLDNQTVVEVRAVQMQKLPCVVGALAA